MKVAKVLFVAYLAILTCCLLGLLLVSPSLSFWHLDASNLALFQGYVQRLVELQILLGATLMLLFGLRTLGPWQTVSFFALCLPLSLVLSTLLTAPGLFPPVAGPGVFFLLLSWFFMGLCSYILAARLVNRLGLRRCTLWSLLLGTYLLIAWNLALGAALNGAHLPGQTQIWHAYGAAFGLPVANLASWTIAALLVLSMSRLFWRSDLLAQPFTIWLPFSLYTANLGFVILLNVGSGLWFPLMLSTCLVLLPESLAYFPREEPHPTRSGPMRASVSQVVWLLMRVGVWSFGRRRLQMSARGVEHLPRSGPVLIAANHVHFLFDGYMLLRAIPRRLHAIVALDWVQARGLRLLIELACSLADWPVVLRSELLRTRDSSQRWAYQPLENRRYLRQIIVDALRLLRASEILVMFPEAYPAIDPHPTPKRAAHDFLPFRPGFLKLVELAERDRQTQVAIVPAGLMYTREEKSWQATINFGPALFLADFASSEEALHTVEERVQALALACTVPPQPI